MECEFCGKSFYSKYTLQTHQKTAKKCVRLNPEQADFKCEFCDKTLNSKQRFEEHVELCKDRKDKIIEELKAELSEKTKRVTELEIKVDVLEKLVDKGWNCKRKQPSNELGILKTDKEYINDILIPFITMDIIKGGYKRIVKCIADNYLTNVYCCVDSSRRKFTFKTSKGYETDIGCEKLLAILRTTDIKARCLQLLNSDRTLSDVFIESKEYGLIFCIFTNSQMFATELSKYLC